MVPSRPARVVVLAAAGLGAIMRGLAYAPWTDAMAGDHPRQLSSVDEWFPPAAWSWVWLAVGAACLVSIWWRTATRTAMSFLSGMLTAWGVSYCIAWGIENTQRSWVTGSLFLMAAAWAVVLTSMLEKRGG